MYCDSIHNPYLIYFLLRVCLFLERLAFLERFAFLERLVKGLTTFALTAAPFLYTFLAAFIACLRENAGLLNLPKRNFS